MSVGRTVWLTVVAALLAIGMARAEEDAFYKGKTIRFIIGSTSGGGFDTDGRLMARHLGRFLAGNPAVVPQNMPGAGSIAACDYLYFTVPKDGTVLGVIDPGVYNSQLLGEPRIRFDTGKFTWVGRMVNNSPVLFTAAKSPIHSWQDLFTKQPIIAAAGPTPRLNYLLLNTVLNGKIKIMMGYPGTSEMMLAMERGEIDGLSMPWPVVKMTKSEWITDKTIIPILQTGAETYRELPDVPRMIDLTKNDDDRKLFEFFALPSLIGRGIVAPPDLPKARTDELRAAFWKMVTDPGFLADAAKSKIDVEPMEGAVLQAKFGGGDEFPPALMARAREVWALSQGEEGKN